MNCRQGISTAIEPHSCKRIRTTPRPIHKMITDCKQRFMAWHCWHWKWRGWGSVLLWILKLRGLKKSRGRRYHRQRSTGHWGGGDSWPTSLCADRQGITLLLLGLGLGNGLDSCRNSCVKASYRCGWNPSRWEWPKSILKRTKHPNQRSK